MTLDKDNDVCVQVMRLLVLMSQNCEDLFTQEDCESLYQFVYTAHRPLAAAAGEFLYKRYLFTEVEGSTEGTKDNARQLKILLTFFCENELHEHLAYLVDSLWDCNPGFLKDWQCMSSILLQDTNEKDALNIIQERLLIELLLASVRQAVIGHPPVGRGTMKKVLSAKEKKVQLEDRVKITEHFAGTLHLLLAKFFTEPEKMANLLQILQYFDMEVYCSLGLNKNLEVLLNQLNHTVEIHSDPEVLEACSKAYISLSKRNLECQANVDLSKKQLMDQLVDTFNKMLHDILHEREVPLNAEDVDQMSCVLRRLAAFHNGHDLTQWNLYQKTSQLLLFEDEHRCLPVQLLLPAFQCMYYALLWKVLAVIEDKPSKEDLVLFKAHLTTFWSLCKHYLHYQDQPMQEQAFLSLCDLLFLLSHRSRGIYCCVDSSLQSELLLFVQHHVFQGDEDLDKAASLSENNEENMEGLYKRRNLLAVYCKLIIYNVVEMAAASEIYKEYIKAYNDFGDIIKEILSRTRQSDRIESAKTLVLCLQQLFQKHKEEYGSASQYSASFSNIKEMARRFSLTFGLDHLKYRESVTMMHKQGIEFAFREPPLKDSGPPPNLPFLILINEFSSKLLKADKRLV
ncbi:hypothetical protein GDO86_020184 [Hymenochirus boettgeri]|uniref:Cohesin subunit SCC3/SA HEAT-repeats domain-containing protein n=1 Tax=Hymenochirus boettgeri TaxID=247094 RepID=A0A8T2IIS2_9PIPI|nr:hypothetical protein GDO86_020184 [Hymenochirus boettgeri]